MFREGAYLLRNKNAIASIAATWPTQKINVHLIVSLISLLKAYLTFAISYLVANVLIVASTDR